MKKLKYFLLLLIVTNNFLVFVFGIVFWAKAANYEKVQQDNYILDSALTLAVQAREDTAIMPLLEAEFSLKKRKAGYVVRKVDQDNDYIKVYIIKNSGMLFREYMRPNGLKPFIMPQSVIKPAATPVPSPEPEKDVLIPEIIPTIPSVKWTIIK